MANLTFYKFHMFTNTDIITKSHCDKFFQSKKAKHDYRNKIYKVEDYNCDKYYSIMFLFGKDGKYSNIVINTDTKNEEPNPRTPKQVEPNIQNFCFYDYNTSILYLTKTDEKCCVENYLSSLFGDNIIIKNRMDINDFKSQIQELTKINFTYANNLHTQNQIKDLSQIIGLDVGTTNLEQLKISANLHPISKTDRLLDTIESLLNKYKSEKISDLIITGKSNDNINQVFKSDHITSKIVVKINSDSKILLDYTYVRNIFETEIYKDTL